MLLMDMLPSSLYSAPRASEDVISNDVEDVGKLYHVVHGGQKVTCFSSSFYTELTTRALCNGNLDHDHVCINVLHLEEQTCRRFDSNRTK